MTSPATTPRPTTPATGDSQSPDSPPDASLKGPIGSVVAGSLTAGLVAALLLIIVHLVPAESDAVLGVALFGFAVGWALLAVLSARFTNQPQRWAFVPAVFMGAGGLVLLGFGTSVVPDWVWPPMLLAVVIWMVGRIHRQLRSRRGRWLLYPVLAVLAIASVGGGYEAVQSATDEEYAMPGILVDVGSHRLHLNCTGSGSPTVVLQAGGGEMSSAFGWIAPAVAEETRVCVYDRAGHGWSESAGTAQDGAEVAADLHTLLERGQVPGPYVLAGHSFGGLYTLTFAALYSDEVAGMVLVDTTAPASEPAPRSTTSDDATVEAMDRVSALLGDLYNLRMVSESTGTARFSADRLPPVGAGLPTARRNLGMALSVVGLPLMTVLLVEVRGTLALASLLLLYLLAVVVIAVVGGTLPAVLGAVVSFVLANLFFRLRPTHRDLARRRRWRLQRLTDRAPVHLMTDGRLPDRQPLTPGIPTDRLESTPS